MLRPVNHPLSNLRPLALGELIDRSATFWRKHLKSLFLLGFGFNLVTYILTKSLQLVMQESLTTLQEAASGGDLGAMGLEYARFLLVTVGMAVASIWLYFLSTLVVSRYAVPLLLGEQARPMDGLQRALQRLGAFTGAYVLSLMWAVGATLLLMLPGGVLSGVGAVLLAREDGSGARVLGTLLLGGGIILALLGLLGGFLWYLLRFSLLAPVMAVEDLSAVRSFQRSGELLSGRVEPGVLGWVKVRAMVLVTVVSGILIAVSLLSGLPALIIQFSYGSPMDPAALAANPVPQALLVPAELLQVVGQAVFSPLGLVFYAMFYLDMRVRREGLDLERRLETHSEQVEAA
jgi:hypothetical protein